MNLQDNAMWYSTGHNFDASLNLYGVFDVVDRGVHWQQSEAQRRRGEAAFGDRGTEQAGCGVGDEGNTEVSCGLTRLSCLLLGVMWCGVM